MPTALLVVPFAILAFSFVLLGPVLFRLFRPCHTEEITPDWLENFSPATYRPMGDLLSDEDFRFLARQPGFDLSLYRKLRRERLFIFRQYMTRLIVDFNRLHMVARLLVAHGRVDRSSTVARLFLLKLKFISAVLHAETSYLLCRLGFGSLVVHTTIARLEQMSAELTALSALRATV